MSHTFTDRMCLEDRGRDECAGPVEHRESLSGTGTRIPRCDLHWEARLEEEERIRSRYPVHAPADFDPAYAGESWDEED